MPFCYFFLFPAVCFWIRTDNPAGLDLIILTETTSTSKLLLLFLLFFHGSSDVNQDQSVQFTAAWKNKAAPCRSGSFGLGGVSLRWSWSTGTLRGGCSWRGAEEPCSHLWNNPFSLLLLQPTRAVSWKTARMTQFSCFLLSPDAERGDFRNC